MFLCSRHRGRCSLVSQEHLFLCSPVSGTSAGGRKEKEIQMQNYEFRHLRCGRPSDNPGLHLPLCECITSTNQSCCVGNAFHVASPEQNQAQLQHFECSCMLPRQPWRALKRPAWITVTPKQVPLGTETHHNTCSRLQLSFQNFPGERAKYPYFRTV